MTRRLTVLNVAYPFAPVGPDAVGGAEQVLSMIDEALVAAGHRSIVIAPERSICAGELAAIPPPAGIIGEAGRRATHALVAARVERVAREARADVVHLHGVDFHAYLPESGVAVLVTLHLPLGHYPPRALVPSRPRTWLHGVSTSQMRDAPPEMPRLPEITNGVRLDRLAPDAGPRRRYAIALGRICPEKGFDDAAEAARRARVPLLVAGRTFPYASHVEHFERRLAPALGRECRFVGGVGPRRKARLLARARCLVVASRIAETSSLVAMEALACGCPVVARRVGALPDLVEHGKTGLLVDDVDSMARALRLAQGLDRAACRRAAEARFDARDTVRRYLDRYERLASGHVEELRRCSA